MCYVYGGLLHSALLCHGLEFSFTKRTTTRNALAAIIPGSNTLGVFNLSKEVMQDSAGVLHGQWEVLKNVYSALTLERFDWSRLGGIDIDDRVRTENDVFGSPSNYLPIFEE